MNLVDTWRAGDEPVTAKDVIWRLFAMARHDCASLIFTMSGVPTSVSTEAVASRDSAEVPGATAHDVELARNGDGDAFARLVAQHQQRIAGTMWRFTRDRTEWEVLVQDVFVEAFFSLKQLKDANAFGAWLQTIATRTGYQFWKRRARDSRRGNFAIDTPGVDREIAIDATSPSEAGELVHHLLALLPPRDRLVLTLMYLESLTVSEIAERCQWSQAMVKVQAHRARKKLKRLLIRLETKTENSVRLRRDSDE